MNDGNNNGQAMHGARKPPGPMETQARMLTLPTNNTVMRSDYSRGFSFTISLSVSQSTAIGWKAQKISLSAE